MKTVLFAGALLLGTGLGCAQGWRFGLPVEALDLTNSIARPGNVRVPLSSTGSLEIINWQTPPSTSNQAGEFVLKLARPLPVGTVIAYEPGEVFFMVSNQWRRLPPGTEEGRKLQILPLPPAETIEALKFVAPARELRDKAEATFQARLSFVTLLPVRVHNFAPEGTVTASSAQSSNGAPILVDGEINPSANFATRKRNVEGTNAPPEWIQLSWARPQALRGVAWFCGAEDPGLAPSRIEVFVSTNQVPAAWTTNGWQTAFGRSTTPGTFARNQFFVAMGRFSTRALRITATGEVSQIGCGEIVVLRELGLDPAPSGKKPPARSNP